MHSDTHTDAHIHQTLYNGVFEHRCHRMFAPDFRKGVTQTDALQDFGARFRGFASVLKAKEAAANGHAVDNTAGGTNPVRVDIEGMLSVLARVLCMQCLWAYKISPHSSFFGVRMYQPIMNWLTRC